VVAYDAFRETPMARVPRPGYVLRAESAGLGPPHLLCLHGLVDTLEVFERVLPGLVRLGSVVRFDQRGHGDSGAPAGPCVREDLAGDAIAVLDHFGIERAYLVGHSMGGIVAMTAALAHPDRVQGLVLLGTAGQCSGRIAQWYEEIAAAGERDGLAGLATKIYGADTRRTLRGDALAIAQVTRMLRSLHTDPLTPKLAALRAPALLLVGERDPMGPRASALLAEALPDARLQVLPGRGHWIHLEAPDELAAALEGWLRARV
jgi:3-oxoadipate enol-lactonase